MLKSELEKENAELKAKIRRLEEEAKSKDKNEIDGISMDFADVSASLVHKTEFKVNGWKKIELTRQQLENLCDKFYIRGVTNLGMFNSCNSSLKGAVGVLFSGGYDSVALTIYLLEKGYTVMPIGMRFNGNAERVLRLCCLKQLQKVYGERLLPCYEFATVFYGDGNTSLAQQPLCHFWMRYLPIEIRRKLSMIAIGYNKTDFGSSIKEKLIDLYNISMKAEPKFYFSLTDVRNAEQDDVFPKIVYPLIENEHQYNGWLVNSFSDEYGGLIIPCVACANAEYALYQKRGKYRITIAPCGDKDCEKCGASTIYSGVKADYIRVLDFENVEPNTVDDVVLIDTESVKA